MDVIDDFMMQKFEENLVDLKINRVTEKVFLLKLLDNFTEVIHKKYGNKYVKYGYIEECMINFYTIITSDENSDTTDDSSSNTESDDTYYTNSESE